MKNQRIKTSCVTEFRKLDGWEKDELQQVLKIDEFEHFSKEQRDRLQSLITEIRDTCSEGDDDVGVLTS